MCKESLYAKVDFETSPRTWSNLRGYGLLTTTTYGPNSQLITNRHVWNRIPAVGGPLDQDLPPTSNNVQLNPSADIPAIAWATKK
jgi:hypothetical protein